MTSLVIRDAKQSDLPSLLEIYNEVVLSSTAIYEEKARSLSEHETWYQQKLASGFPLFVAESDGKIAGYCSYGTFRNWTCYKPTVELSLYVEKNFRGKGVGSKMLKHLIEDARKREFHSMVAGIDATNEASLYLHERLGFTKVATFREVGFKFNRWLDLVFMQIILQ